MRCPGDRQLNIRDHSAWEVNACWKQEAWVAYLKNVPITKLGFWPSFPLQTDLFPPCSRRRGASLDTTNVSTHSAAVTLTCKDDKAWTRDLVSKSGISDEKFISLLVKYINFFFFFGNSQLYKGNCFSVPISAQTNGEGIEIASAWEKEYVCSLWQHIYWNCREESTFNRVESYQPAVRSMVLSAWVDEQREGKPVGINFLNYKFPGSATFHITKILVTKTSLF